MADDREREQRQNPEPDTHKPGPTEQPDRRERDDQESGDPVQLDKEQDWQKQQQGGQKPQEGGQPKPDWQKQEQGGQPKQGGQQGAQSDK